LLTQLLQIAEVILEWVRSTKKPALSVDPMGVNDNSYIKQLLHIQDKYLKKLHNDGYLVICEKATSTGIEVVTSSLSLISFTSPRLLPRRNSLEGTSDSPSPLFPTFEGSTL
jgi:hypothetical protein